MKRVLLWGDVAPSLHVRLWRVSDLLPVSIRCKTRPSTLLRHPPPAGPPNCSKSMVCCLPAAQQCWLMNADKAVQFAETLALSRLASDCPVGLRLLPTSSPASIIAAVDAACRAPADLCFCNKSMTCCPPGSGSSRSCSLDDKSCQAPSELAWDRQASTCTGEQGSRSPCCLHAQHAMVSVQARLVQMHGTRSVLVALSSERRCIWPDTHCLRLAAATSWGRHEEGPCSIWSCMCEVRTAGSQIRLGDGQDAPPALGAAELRLACTEACTSSPRRWRCCSSSAFKEEPTPCCRGRPAQPPACCPRSSPASCSAVASTLELPPGRWFCGGALPEPFCCPPLRPSVSMSLSCPGEAAGLLPCCACC